MKIYIYKGGLSLVAKSGVGSAIRHQEKMLRAAKVTVTDVWKEADIVQIRRGWHGGQDGRGKRSSITGIPPWKILRILLSVPIWRLLYSKNGSAIVIDREMWLSHQRNTPGNC